MDDGECAARKLLAAVTVTGAALWLTSTGATARNSPMTEPFCKPLSLRVQELQEKVRASSPLLDEGAATGKVQNIVQFFNFLNCKRRSDGSCE